MVPKIEFPLKIILSLLLLLPEQSIMEYIDNPISNARRVKCFELALAEIQWILFSKREMSLCDIQKENLEDLKTYLLN